jgi:uncharacterized protein
MRRILAAGLLLAAVASSAVHAESPACAGIEARWESGKADLQTPQISALLFATADNGCPAVAETLLAAGALIEAKDRFGNTPLIHAAREGQIGMAQTLLAHGADIALPNLAGSTPLFVAIEHHQPAAAAFLIAHGADANQIGRSGVPPISVAAFSADDATAALLLAHGAKPGVVDHTGKTAIVYAAGNGSAAIIKRLLAAGVAVNERYDNELTALMWAAGHADDVVESAGTEAVAALLDAGARIDDADNRGRTSLMIAAERGHAAIVSLLLARGANPKLRDNDGKSAHDLAFGGAVKAALPAPPG